MAMRANPGKFNTALDEAVWSLSLDGGADEEVGSSSEAPGTWAGILHDGEGLARQIDSNRDEYPNVTKTELELLRESGSAGVILMEDSSGSVTVKYYDDPSALSADWKECEEALSLDDDEHEPNARGRSHKLPDGTRVTVYDNGGETIDRYSVAIEGGGWEEQKRGDMVPMLGIGASPRSYSEFSEGQKGRHLGKIVSWDDLPEEIRNHIWSRVRTDEQTKNGREGNVDTLARMSLTKLRRHQALNSKQIEEASRTRNTSALEELQRREREIDQAIMQREFGQTKNARHRRNPKLNLDRNRIQKALDYVHRWTAAARGARRQTPREAANYAARMQGLNEEERRVLLSALHIEASQHPPTHKKNTSIVDRRKAGVIEGLTKAEMDSMEIQIPTFDWKQIGGDMDPGKHGGMIARADGDQIEIIEIQPVRELVGDGEAKDVGFPFWSKEGTYDLSDLSLSDEHVQSAIESAGLGEHLLDMTPEQRAVAIAEACMQAGHRSEESSSGWAKDVLGGRIVDWMSGDRAGYEHIADEDEEFRKEILGQYYELVDGDQHVRWFADDEEQDAIDQMATMGERAAVKLDGEIVYDNLGDEELEPNRRARGHRRNAGGEGSSHYRTISEIKEANNAAGFFFFKKDTIKFWRSKIEPRVYGGRYFITSEQMGDDQPRLFSVREAHPSGRITTAASGLRGKGAAEDAIGALLGQHTPNTPRPVLEREGTLDQLLEMQAETLEPDGRGRVPREVKDALQVTEGLRKAVGEYEAALEAALDEVVRQYPPNDGASAYDLFSDKAPYLVLMTLRGEGVGIWDGDWDAHYDSDQIKKVQALLEHKLGRYADSSGSGLITNALDDAVFEAMRDAGYEFDEHTYVKVSDDEGDDDEMEKNQRGHRRWHIFLNGELLEPVYMDPSYTADEVKRYLVKAGYSPAITVDQPPERRTGLPPHYRAGSMSQNRRSRR